jgi:hypothetical protein
VPVSRSTAGPPGQLDRVLGRRQRVVEIAASPRRRAQRGEGEHRGGVLTRGVAGLDRLRGDLRGLLDVVRREQPVCPHRQQLCPHCRGDRGPVEPTPGVGLHVALVPGVLRRLRQSEQDRRPGRGRDARAEDRLTLLSRLPEAAGHREQARGFRDRRRSVRMTVGQQLQPAEQ